MQENLPHGVCPKKKKASSSPFIAPLMSVGSRDQVKWVTDLKQVDKWVIFLFTVAKQKMTPKVKRGKDGRRIAPRKKVSSRAGFKEQLWSVADLDLAFEANKNKPPKEKPSKLAISKQTGIPYTTVCERLSGHCGDGKRGKIAGGRHQSEVLDEGEQAGNITNLSIARAISANPTQIRHFFNQYKEWVDNWELEYLPNNIWNVDECGVGDVAQPSTVVGVTGEHSFQTVSGEKPTNTTIVSYISAGGMTIPPLVIFKAARIKPEWREAAPTGYMIRGSASGYINAKLFQEYGEQFVRFVTEKKILTRD